MFRLKYQRHTVSYDGTFVADSVNHEFAHSIYKERLRKEYEQAGNRTVRYKDTKIGKTTLEAFRKAKNNGDIFKISAYAAKDEQEFFSECFAIYRVDKEKLPDYIIDMLKGVLKK